MNIYPYITKDYENKHNWTLGQNKPNSNPIKPNYRKAKMNANSLITKDYRKKDDFAVRKNKHNSNPISEKPKMNANAFSQKDYENETTLRPQKNKPKQSQWIKRLRSIFRRFILATLTQAPHINITALIVDPNTRTPPKMNKKKPEKQQVSVLTMGMGIFSSFFFVAGM
jgi:hypothetical protein